jgi:hypothetical protein
LIKKPEDIKPPETHDEAKKMIIDDISCICEALCHLIKMADLNGYADKKSLVSASTMYLNEIIADNN